MNKFEKLIEYIINDEDQKARELFHDIVVEKSRDIYESIMDDEQVEEQVAGDQVGELAQEISAEESVHEEENDEVDLDNDDQGDDMSGDLSMEPSDEMDSDAAEHNEIEDKVMNIDAKLDELLAKFDEIMGGESMDSEAPSVDAMGDEPSMDHDMEHGDETFNEGEQIDELKNATLKSYIKKATDLDDNRSISGLGVLATAKHLSGSESDTGEKDAKKSRLRSSNISNALDKLTKDKTESRRSSTTELMREYVDRIGDIYGGAGDAAEGDAVGATGKKTSINTKNPVGPGANFGGTTATSKGGEQNQDGTSAPSTAKPQDLKSGNLNVPGGKAGNAFKSKESAKTGEESSVNDKSPQKPVTGK